MSNKNPGVHITPRDDGRWSVIRDGAERSSSVHDTQADATAAGRNTARREETELYIHGRDAITRLRDSYANDPYPPRG